VTIVDGIEYVTPAEGRALVEAAAQKYLGMSADEFVCRYQAGELDGCESDVARIVMLLPFMDDAAVAVAAQKGQGWAHG
jgi:hypothetical protein